MTSGNICPVCGGGIKEDEGACSVCGTVFIPPGPDQSETAPVETEDTAPESIKCPDCGNMVPAGKNICDECGSRIGMASEDEYEDMEEPDEDEEEVEERIVDVGKEVDELDQGPIEIDEDFDPTNLGKDMEDILKLPGVGPLRAKILMEAGYTDLIKLKRASVMELIKIKGIGRKSAGEIKTALRDMKLQDIRSKELDLESIEKEGACPLCNTIVSVYESACYECGTTLRDHHAQVVEGDQDSMALAYYDTKLKEDPNNKEMWYARGATMIKMEEFDKALSSFDKALEIDPNYQNVWISKAEVFNKMGEPMKAADCYSHVISTTGIETDYEHIDEALEKHDRAMEEKEMGADEQITSMELDEAEEEEIDDEVISFEVEDDVAEEPETETVPEPEPDDEEVEYEEVEVIEYVEVEEDEAAEENVEEPVVEPTPEPDVVEEPVTESITEAEPDILETPAEPVVEPEAEYAEIEIDDDDDLPDLASGDEVEEEEAAEETVEEPVVEPTPEPTPEPEPEPEEDETDPKVLKKSLSIHASAIKPLLLLAKELSIDVLEQKKLIAQGVNESKKKNLLGAVELMRDGRKQIEEAFVQKANEELGNIAEMARELKLDGYNVDSIIGLLNESKELLDHGDFKASFDKMNECLSMVENIRTS